MKILIFHNSTDLYGSSRILLYTVEVFKKQGYNCLVVVSSEGLFTEELTKLKVNYKIINLGVLRRKYFNVKGIINRALIAKKSWKLLNVLIQDFKPNIIFTNTTVILISAFLAKKHKVTHVWHLHEIIVKPKLLSLIIGYIVNRYSDKVIVVSNAVRYHWEKFIDPSKITRVYNGIKPELYNTFNTDLRKDLCILDEEIVITMIARVNHWKGQNYFLDIATLLNISNTNLKFIMVGDSFPGNEYMVDELEARIAKLPFKNNLINLNYRSDVNEILKATDIFICPSILPDPFPTVILEAMAAGKAIVSTSQGGALEMIDDNQNGLLIPINNPKEAAVIIQTLIDDKEKRLQFAKEAKLTLDKNFSFNAFQQNLLHAINN